MSVVALEPVIRPWQSPQVTQSGQIALPSLTTVKPASLRWGAVGKLPPVLASFKVTSGDSYNEQSRTTDVVRIFNPSDSSQYVDTQRTDTLNMTHTRGGAAQAQASAWNSDIGAAFSEFDAQVQQAINDISLDGPTTGGTADQATFTFHPPA